MNSANESLERLYRSLPKMRCKGLCHGACGPIGMSAAELENMRRAAGDRLLVAPLGNGDVLLSNKASLTCPLLKNGRCSIYDQRPLICRLWGMVKSMRCPHGCRPSRWLSDTASHALLDAARKLHP